MKLVRIVDLINQHNENKIEIHQINGEFGPLMVNISHLGRLTYFPADYKIEFVDKNGETQSVVDLDKITTFSFSAYTEPVNNGNNGNNGGDNGGNTNPPVVKPLDAWNIYDDLRKVHIIENPHIDENGVMYPAILSNGYLIYDISAFKGTSTNLVTPEVVIRSSDYSDYMGNDGWVELNRGGTLTQKIAIPSKATYAMKVVAGSDSNIARNATMHINSEFFNVTTDANSKYVWGMESVTRAVPTLSGIMDTNGNFDFSTDTTFNISFELKDNNSKIIDLDSIVLRPLPKKSTPAVNTDEDLIEPVMYDDIMAFPASQGELYDGDLGFTLPKLKAKDSLITRFVDDGSQVQVGNSNLVMKLDSPADDYYQVGILAKYAPTNRDGMFQILINGTDQYYARYYGTRVNKGTDIYQINLYKYSGGDMSTLSLATRVHLNKGKNTFTIKNYFETEDVSYVPNINGVLVTKSLDYNKKSNDDGRLLLPNYRNVYFTNNEDGLNAALADNRSDVRSAVNLTQSYIPANKELGFDFMVSNLGFTNENDVTDPRVTYDNVLNVGGQRYSARVTSVFRPHLTIIGTPEGDGLTRTMLLSFYILEASQTQNTLYGATGQEVKTTTNMAGRSLFKLDLPQVRLDLGESYKETYMHQLDGIDMVDKVYIVNQTK